jgi:hypothetical protein
MKIWIMSRRFLVPESNGNVGLKLADVAVGRTNDQVLMIEY